LFVIQKKYIWWSLGKVRTRKKNVINVILDPFIDFLLFKASCVMARNTLAKSYYIDEKFIPKEKVIVAPNSMNHHKEVLPKSSTVEFLTSLKGNSTVMLYVGALTSTKRPADLIYSLKHILNLNPYSDLKLWFVGDGPEKNALEQLVQDLSLVNNVNFFGKIFDGVGAYFQVSDFVVVPGLGGLVINHAMIYGKPVISRLADGTELDLVVDGVTGFIVDDYKLENLVDKIILIINSDLGLMSKNCKLLVSDTWNIDIMFSRNLDCIYFKGN